MRGLMKERPPRNGRTRARHAPLYFAGGLCSLLLLAGCIIPNHVGLRNELGATITQSRTTAMVGSGSSRIRFGGWHEVQEGSITIVVTAPDGSEAFVHTYDAVSQSTLDFTFDRQPGEWSIDATTTPGRGSYLIGLSY